jgi:hypothetical protein
MPSTIRTGRGIYTISSAAPPERLPDATVLTLSLERADGIEKVAFKVRIDAVLLDGLEVPDPIIERLAPWIEREFEMTRETALKTIRVERRLFEVFFDASNRGPFVA